MAASGVDLEIIESGTTSDDVGVVVPNRVRINGQEVLIPSGTSICIGDLAGDDAVTVTVTMFVRSLVIKAE